MARPQQLAIFGDVHGDAPRLRAALASSFTANRRLIFLGDFVSRGQFSREVLELLCSSLQDDATRHIVLRGNHEQALLDYVKDGNFAKYASSGGLPLLKSYLPRVFGDVHSQFLRTIPPSHLHVLESSELWYEDDSIFCSHAGPDPASPCARGVESLVLGHRSYLPRAAPNFGKLIVCGHYLQLDANPFSAAHVICLETGSGLPNGRLSVLLMPERRIVQF